MDAFGRAAVSVGVRMVAVIGLYLGTMHAQGAIFLKIPGIPGEATNAQHADEIDATSWTWSVELPASTNTGGGGAAAKPLFGNLRVTKKFDKATPLLARAVAAGTMYPTATLSVRNIQAGQDVIVIELTDVSVAAVEVSAEGDVPTETIALRYKQVTWTYRYQGAGGVWQTVARSWNITTNSANNSADEAVLKLE